MLQAFLRTATDGWTIALSSVRDLLVEEDLHPSEVGADFASEAERLGEATAEIHADLAEVFGVQTLSGDQLAGLAGAMTLRLEAAIGVVPELAKHEQDYEHGSRRWPDTAAGSRSSASTATSTSDRRSGQSRAGRSSTSRASPPRARPSASRRTPAGAT